MPRPSSRADIRVLLVDDHPQVRTMLAEILDDEDDLTVVGECADGCEVVEAAERLQPDVVCMDMSMPVMDGLAATEALRSAGADVPPHAGADFRDRRCGHRGGSGGRRRRRPGAEDRPAGRAAALPALGRRPLAGVPLLPVNRRHGRTRWRRVVPAR